MGTGPGEGSRALAGCQVPQPGECHGAPGLAHLAKSANRAVLNTAAVIDTNVLVSGLLSPAGNEVQILLAVHKGLVRPCFSEEILEEYPAVLARPKFAFPPDEIATGLGGKQSLIVSNGLPKSVMVVGAGVAGIAV